jgi:hypothetical protein
MVQVIEHFPTKHEALSSITWIIKNKETATITSKGFMDPNVKYNVTSKRKHKRKSL